MNEVIEIKDFNNDLQLLKQQLDDYKEKSIRQTEGKSKQDFLIQKEYHNNIKNFIDKNKIKKFNERNLHKRMEKHNVLHFGNIETYLNYYNDKCIKLKKNNNLKNVIQKIINNDNSDNCEIKNILNNAYEDIKPNTLKKLILSPQLGEHTFVYIIGNIDNKKIILSTERDFSPLLDSDIYNNNNITKFILPKIQHDDESCGVFAIEICKHIDVKEIKDFIEKHNNNINNISYQELPYALLKYTQSFKALSDIDLKKIKAKYLYGVFDKKHKNIIKNIANRRADFKKEKIIRANINKC